MDQLKRRTHEPKCNLLFDLAPDWREHWWAMPEFSMQDASPQHRMQLIRVKE